MTPTVSLDMSDLKNMYGECKGHTDDFCWYCPLPSPSHTAGGFTKCEASREVVLCTIPVPLAQGLSLTHIAADSTLGLSGLFIYF